MLKDFFHALLEGPDQIRYFRHTYSPLSPWRRRLDEVVEQTEMEAARYGLRASVDRRRAYQVARMVVSNRRGDHLVDVVPDAYLAYSPPSAASYHTGKSSYEPPEQRRLAFRRHPQTLAYLLTPPAMARLGVGASTEGGLVVIQPGEEVGQQEIESRLRERTGGKVGSDQITRYAEVLVRLSIGIPEEEDDVEAAA